MIPMMNMYETIRDNLHFNKFVVGELLFVEYKCPIEQDVAGVWTPMDYFVHVVSGKQTWRTTEGCWTLEKGQTLFFKKKASPSSIRISRKISASWSFSCRTNLSGTSSGRLPGN